MPDQCVDFAKEAHQPAFDIVAAAKAKQILPTCDPAYQQCIQNLSDDVGMCSRFNYSLVQAIG